MQSLQSMFTCLQFTVCCKYHNIQFHYRSIDSWLEGVFESHCSEHKWLDERANEWLSDKFSVFADPSLDDINMKDNGVK